MQAHVYAKAILLGEPGQLLLLRRSQTDPKRPGEWDFAGGKVEEGEEITQGVVREIFEEAGLKLNTSAVRLVYAATVDYEETSVTRLLFVGQAPASEIKLSYEHDKYQWVDYKKALELFPHFFYGVGLKYALDHDLLS
ncbi:MAG TPA: NUDIX domain-containing protein [Candidatus Binatia bacterium]|nr:NUDIX domain-containing protein [Candidatus Binatia bacterium]